MKAEKINEKDLAKVAGGITKDEFYKIDAVAAKFCTRCGGTGTISTEEGTEADGRIYVIARCSACNGAWKTYLDPTSAQPVI